MSGQPLIQRWLQDLSTTVGDSTTDVPRYWQPDRACLVSTANVLSLTLGTGLSIYATSAIPLIESAEQEVILVTCFWAHSQTLDALSATLRHLSQKALEAGQRIRVRIYFSSSSVTQKLFHPQTLQGRTWEPSTWTSKLSLPSEDELPGLDMRIKSIFLLPFSVMHPKFVIVDRSRVLVPSCNVSWEDWFEGCVELSGAIVQQFVHFWQDFWATEDDAGVKINDSTPAKSQRAVMQTGPQALASRHLNHEGVDALFLPSPHHCNPRFAFAPWQSWPPPPQTPLNTFLLAAIRDARSSIYVQTPNLTAPPILSALLAALRRGVEVTVVTSERLMILEQLLTAGTTTARCMRKLIKRYRRLQRDDNSKASDSALLESGSGSRAGSLSISYYQPLSQRLRDDATAEPVQSHLKLTIIDEEWTVLGSGNLDRASLFTSQELGVAFCSRGFAATVRGEVDMLVEHRRKRVFCS